MAFNGTGTYLREYNWASDKGNQTPITASRVDGEADSIATALSLCICRDGQSTTTAAIPFAIGLRASDGLVGTPSIAFTSDTNTGFWRNTSDQINVSCGGVLSHIFAAGGFYGPDGSAAAPSISFANDANTGFYGDGGNSIHAASGGARVGGFNSVGLGLGTSLSAAAEWLGIAAGTTAKAQINLASSTAPTAPNNGDVWFDGSALKIRIAGVTRTVTVS